MANKLLSIILLLFMLPAAVVANVPDNAGNTAIQPAEPISLTPAEKAWVATHKTVRVGMSPIFPPVKFSEKGVIKGIEPDYLQLLAAYTGIKFEYVICDFPVMDARVKSGEIDMLLSFYIPERLSYMTFTEPWMDFKTIIVTRNDSPFISGIGSLNGKRLATVKGVKLFDKILALYPRIERVQVDTMEEMYRAVAEFRADALISKTVFAGYQMKNFPNLKIAGITDLSPEPFLYAVRKDYPELVSILNKAILAIPKEQQDAIVQKWFSVRLEYRPSKTELLKWVALFGGIFTVILGLTLYWNKRMQKEIDRRLETEKSLRESETRYRELFNNISSGVAIYEVINNGEDFVFLDFNRTAEQLDNNRKTDVIGKSIYQVRPGIEEFGLLDVFRRVWATGIPEHYPVRFYHDECLKGWYDNFVYRLPTGEIVAVYDDVTERRLWEESLRMSEQRLALVLEGSQLGFWDWNIVTGEVVRNEQWAAMLGYTLEEIDFSVGQWTDLLHPDDRDFVWDSINTHLDGLTQQYEIEYRMRSKNGEYKWILDRARIVKRDANGRPVRMCGTHTDITDRKQAEEEKLVLAEQFQQSQKLESLGVLAGGVAHDFNNILTAIIGNAEIALMKLNPESPVMTNLQQIEQSAMRAADLARQMLAYSGKGKFLIENLDLNRLLEEMLHMLEVSISRKASLQLNLAPQLPAVEADASQIRQIVMNLVINASEAIGGETGIITIRTGSMECDKEYFKKICLNSEADEGVYVYLEISDTGCGMDKETLGRIFDPFFSTKFIGRGLGMAAVHGIIRGHRGAIKVYSEPGRGTTFKVLLPAVVGAARILSDGPEIGDWQGSGKILLVDDEELLRNVGAELLGALGYTVITANDGVQALEIYKAAPDIACVILDLTMPHMDGEECFRELRRLSPGLKIVMASGYSEHEVARKFAGMDVAGYIQKPYSLSVLREVLKNALSP